MITITDVASDGIVKDYSFIEFLDAFGKTCQAAWTDGLKDVTTITLPQGLFPNVMELVNPVTRSIVTIERVDLISLCDFAKPVWASSE